LPSQILGRLPPCSDPESPIEQCERYFISGGLSGIEEVNRGGEKHGLTVYFNSSNNSNLRQGVICTENGERIALKYTLDPPFELAQLAI
jgi:hypothetical protein